VAEKKENASGTARRERADERIHVALPIRITYWDKDKKPTVEMACTYDISSRGARITNLRCLKGTGEIVAVERGRNKSFCRVVWVGDPTSELRGQIGLQNVDKERAMWDNELRDAKDAYEPIPKNGARKQPALNRPGNRRRSNRFHVDGVAEVLKSARAGKDTAKSAPQKVQLKDLSESGCLVHTKEVLVPGTDLKLVLKIANCDLTIKGQVRHSVDMGVGIEFSEIRKGDRQTLKNLLIKLAEKQGDDTIEVELVQ
jgi:hypothetical protein